MIWNRSTVDSVLTSLRRTARPRPRNGKQLRNRPPMVTLEPLEPRYVLDSTVVLNELMYHPRVDDGPEWIELHNQQGVNMDISAWRLDGGIDFTFPEGTLVEGGGYLVVSADPEAMAGAGIFADALGPFTGSLANNGEEILLRNNNDRIMDAINYDDNFPWPQGPDGSGATLAKIGVDTASDDATNWAHSAQVGGTPGLLNFAEDTIEQISLDFVSVGDSASIHIPVTAELGSDWTSDDYVQGSRGEAWSDGATGVGFFEVEQGEPYHEVVLADSPLAYWRFSETDTQGGATNLGTLGAAADGTFAADAQVGADSLIGQAGDHALGLTPDDDESPFVSPGFEKLGGGGRTIEFWFSLDSIPTRNVNLVGDGQGALDFGMLVQLTRDAQLRVFVKTDINFIGISQFDSERTFNVGEVVHVVAAWDAATGERRLYLDGTEANQVSHSGSEPTGNAVNTDNPIYVGRDNRGAISPAGRIDEVAIYDYVLGPDRLAAHFEAGRPTFAGLFQTEVTDMHQVSSSAYLRQTFEVPNNVDIDQLKLSVVYDDAFVAYINGTEVARRNVAGDAAFDSTALGGRTFDDARHPETIDLSAEIEHLQTGTNVLALHGINVAAGDEDFVISPSLSGFGTERPPEDAARIAFHEISAASDATFQIELRNDGKSPVNLENFVLVLDGDAPNEYSFSNVSLQPGGLLTLSHVDLGFRPAAGDRLFLYNADRSALLDAREVTNRLRGRSTEHGNRWLYPDTATFGSPNSFDLNTDVVINEIMYHHSPQQGRTGVPPTFARAELIALDDVWRYNDSGQALNSDWHETSHPVDDNWQAGPGLIGFQRFDFVLPPPGLGTTLANPRTVTPRVTTFYFELDFNVTEEDLADVDHVELEHVIDDGAIFYLNGSEVHRINMPSGAVTSSTLASRSVSLSTSVSDPFTISTDALTIGLNRLSVEVHQESLDSDDIMFGARLSVARETDPGQPELPFLDILEQWIELYNRGADPVDLTGWSFSDGIDFDFAAGTTIEPGEYLVVSNDAVALSEKFPAARVIGDFDGRLARLGERIELQDSTGNPADIVDYRDRGRWDGLADGGGSSLELRDPDADNSVPEAWQASDETDGGTWQTVTYQGPATNTVGPSQYQELILGLLDSGEVLLDDISVIEDPAGDARQLIQNGTFETDTVGEAAATWRIIGTHEQSHVAVDPDDPTNQVLKLIATGTTEHMHNHAETTLKDGDDFVTINASSTYEISFRAKWLAGSGQLNSRLYFNRLPRTTSLERPTALGTPGMQNSAFQENIGPTYANLTHFPTIPSVDRDVTVSVMAADPDGISSMTLYYAVDGGEFSGVPMVGDGAGQYSGAIPGQSAATIVQFYVEGVDGNGGVSAFPHDGPASRALYTVEDGMAGDFGNHNFRIVMTTADADRLHEETNVMSNARIGATLIYDESQVYYDVGVRLKGSERGRNQDVRVGFNLRFDPLHLFRGVHRTIGVDRSGSGNEYSQEEILVKQTMNHAGGVTDLQDDLIYLIAPRERHTGSALLQMARYKDVFLDSQFENGSDGDLFKYELIYYPTTTTGGPEGLKRPEPDQVQGVGLRSLGDDKENYRWHFLIRNNIAEDDYSGLMQALEVMGLSGDAFHEQAQGVLDVDQWLRSFAVQTLWGVGDNYTTGAQHNAYFYLRPSDGRMLFLPWDVDFTGTAGATSSLSQNGDLNKLLTLPENEHFYYGHIHDIVTTSFNRGYMDPWIDHYQSFLTSPPSTSILNFKNYIGTRSQHALNVINNDVAVVDFAITTNGGADLTIADSQVTLGGTGWIDVREVRLTGSATPLDVAWPAVDQWQVTLPVSAGDNSLVLEAYDLRGNLVGTDSIVVTSNVSNPVVDSLRITELNYHPHDPTAAELALNPQLDANDIEFIEFTNVGSETINPVGTTFTDGLDYTFPSIDIAPGQRVVVAKDIAAFQLRYGTDITPIGEFDSGGLNNAGERLALVDGLGQMIVDFTYEDGAPWSELADGIGATLEVVDAQTTPSTEYDTFWRWRGSTELGGSPGSAPAEPIGVVVNEVLAHTDPPIVQTDSIELLNTTDAAIDIGGWYLSDARGNLLKFEIPAGTMLGAGEYIVFDEDDFNPSMGVDPGHFALSGAAGDDVYVVITDENGEVVSFVDEVHFGASANGESIGRVPGYDHGLAPLRSLTLGATNGEPRVGPLLISELHYAPGDPSAAALAADPTVTADQLEFIEVHNPTNEAVELTDWRLRGGVDFNFDDGMTIAAGETLVILSFNPDAAENVARRNAFRAHYGLGAGLTLLGGYGGQLNDFGERVVLQRPDTPPPEDPNLIPRLSEDEVLYDNVPPWAATAAGGGDSLQRSAADQYGNLAGSWFAAAATPGTVAFGTRGDFTGDGVVDADDIDALFEAIRSGEAPPEFDLDGSSEVDQDDVVFLVENILGTFMGDATLDGKVDAMDLNQVGINWRAVDVAGWRQGDFSGDGNVTAADLNIIGVNWRQGTPVAAAGADSHQRVPRAPLAEAAKSFPVATVDLAFGEGSIARGFGKKTHSGKQRGMPGEETAFSVQLNVIDGVPARHTIRATPHAGGYSRSTRAANEIIAVGHDERDLVDDVFSRLGRAVHY